MGVIMMLYPLKFKPLYKSYIWGGRNLENYKKDLPHGIVGESWEVSCHPDGESIVANGRFGGMFLNQLIELYPTELLGKSVVERYRNKFPLLIKLIDANERLSVQVHPDDEYAMSHSDGEFGKNEMWYILEAKLGARLIYDVVPGTTKEDFQGLLNKGRVENCLNSIEVRRGDVIYIPAGVLHAIGAGIVLAEVQQNSNLTYRVFDYNRADKDGKKRELHIDKALDVIKFDFAKREETPKVMDIRMDSGFTVSTLVSCNCFEVEKYSGEGKMDQASDDSKFFIYMITEGGCQVSCNRDSLSVTKGETVMIPASGAQFSLQGRFEALKVYVP